MVALKALDALAWFGFLAALTLHACSFVWDNPPGLYPLMFGVLVVFIPAWAAWMVIDASKRSWISLLKATPTWMKWLCLLLALYPWFWLDRGTPSQRLSGCLMVFYLIPAGLLYTVLKDPSLVFGFRCPRGHRVSEKNRFCPDCGEALPSRLPSA